MKSLYRSGRTMTLEDGTKRRILKSVKVVPGTLKKGAMVTATYEEQGGKNVVNSIEVQPPSKS